jgi:hypothetical protein
MSSRIRRHGNQVFIGQSASDQLGFYGTAPVTQPTNAAQAALTDNTGSTPSATLAAIAAGAGYTQADMVAVKNAIGGIAVLVNRLRLDLVNLGIIKGS